ncbi:family 16 glycosylhydrolase [Deinococcus yunweiensis]|uniref:glycoside hydrolase family 16 protein n=1 Tax=Deinococcus yunweiensis TaxID=367282 RepID=UPI00398ECD79
MPTVATDTARRCLLRLAVLCGLSTAFALATPPALPAPAGTWTLVWSDEFGGPAGSQPAAKWWNYDLGNEEQSGWGNNELQYYTNNPANVRLDGQGFLEIWARKNSAELWCFNGYACPYTSARLTTRGRVQFTYGKVEARMSLPQGQGYWPAFWMLGEGLRWPERGEVDVMEFVGKTPTTIYGTLHGPGYSGGQGLTKGQSVQNVSGYHTYTVIKRRDEIVWLLDGQPYHRVTPQDIPKGSEWVFDRPMHLLLNLAVGGNWPGSPDATTKFPGVLKVDYVRVWREGK